MAPNFVQKMSENKNFVQSSLTTNAVDDNSMIYASDGFDPLSSATETLYENIHISHNAPDENMYVFFYKYF